MTGSDAPQATQAAPPGNAGASEQPAAGTVDVAPYLDLLARDPTFLNRLLDAAQHQQTQAGATPPPLAPAPAPAMAQPSPQDRALPAVPAAAASASPPAPTATDANDDDWPCQWTGCAQRFTDSDGLLQHLDADHIGRKKLGNLCLECKWVLPDGQLCGVAKTKRDHITSHLRVHIRAQPHVCETCRRRFKRDYDLRKHERTHAAESSSTTNRGVADESSCTPSLFKQMEKKMTDQFKALLQSHFRSSASGSGSSRSMSSKGSSSSASSTTSPSPAAHAATTTTTTGAASAGGTQYAQNDGLADLLGPAVGAPAITAPPPGSSMSPMNLGGMGLASTTSPMAHVSPPMAVSPYGSSSTTTTKSMSPANLGTKRPALDDLDQFLEDIKRQRVAPVYDETLMAALDTLPSVPTTDPLLLDMDPTSLSTVLAYLDTLDANMMLDAELANLLATDPLLVGVPGLPPTYASATAPYAPPFGAAPPPPLDMFPAGIQHAPPPFAAPGTMLGIDPAAAAAAAAAMYGYAPAPPMATPMPPPMMSMMPPPMGAMPGMPGMAPPQLPPRPAAAPLAAPGYLPYASAPPPPPAPYPYANPYVTPPYAAVAAPAYNARASSSSSSSKANDYEDEKGAMVLGNVKPEDRRAAQRAKREARRAARSAERSGRATPPAGEQPTLRGASGPGGDGDAGGDR
ncbi:hypothetical protein AMAG_20380 [Allomyces macrogynus ATCC 38327]|uniref:C2H2-type domain-containing protein n=1 Tax=Allomyces macrogynus (strain ATCC 38327) TaxID=578462 RepID=A0A0L0T9Y1_ALLM3|nr:hypothetical protein AMAG_20380 [Allomyces macrogynus ATCC 38327]|eukprot:KNE71526.1 hypothetical protein AMAG_20380 [Allomyces macrogynus ATCC 38327]